MDGTSRRHEFRVSRTKLQHGVLLGGVLGVIGLAALLLAGPLLPDGRTIGLINLALAAGVLIYVLRTARDPRPRLVVDDAGLWYRDWSLGVVPWAQVADAYIVGSRLNTFACVEVRSPEALLAGLDDKARRRLRSNRLVRPPQLIIPNGALDAGLDEIIAAIHAARPGAER
jgi:hypothetical protein